MLCGKITASLPKTNVKFPTPSRMPSASAPNVFLLTLKTPALWHTENAELPSRKKWQSGSLKSLQALPLSPSPFILLVPIFAWSLFSAGTGSGAWLNQDAKSIAVVIYFRDYTVRTHSHHSGPLTEDCASGCLVTIPEPVKTKHWRGQCQETEFPCLLTTIPLPPLALLPKATASLLTLNTGSAQGYLYSTLTAKTKLDSR